MSLVAPSAVTEKFLDLLQENFEASLQDDTLAIWRSRAWDRFLELGLPTVKQENYRTVPLRHLYTTDFQLAERPLEEMDDVSAWIFPECNHSYLVFVDGFFIPHLSDVSAVEKQLVVLPIQEAMQSYGVLMQNQWNKVLAEETEPFSVLNMALHTDGLFLHLPENCQISQPVQILHVTTSSANPRIISPRVQLFLGKNASLQIVHHDVSLSSTKDWCNQKWSFVLEENAKLTLFDSAGLPNNRIYTNHVRATQKKKSSFTTFSFSEGACLLRNDYQSILSQQEANVEFLGLWTLQDTRENHTHIRITHAAENCQSKQFFKGILDQESKASFEGKIYVEAIAQKTEAYQLNRNLLLSKDAKVTTKPNLEIFADDVKASHGATVTQLSEESLLYLLARGLSKKQAYTFLTQAFWKEYIEMLPQGGFKKWVENCCQELSKDA